MAKVTLMPSGINAAITSDHERNPGVRRKCKGWSAGACRRNAKFLRTVRYDRCFGVGFTATLTVADLPESAEAWAVLRNTMLKRIFRMGCIRLHWVTEWTRRGVPHLHLVFWLDFAGVWTEAEIEDAWVEIAGHLGSAPQGQCVKKLTDAVGWFGYVAKHSARGVGHYQRQMDALPEEWDTVGRVWGKRGDWDCLEVSVEIEDDVFYELRRLVRSYLVSEARSDLKRELIYGVPFRIKAARRRIRFAKGMLRCHKPKLSAVRGLGHWIDGDAQEEILSASWLLADAKRTQFDDE